MVVRGRTFSFSDLPRHINGNLSIDTDGNNIEYLEGFPDEVNGDINISLAGLGNPGKYHKLIKKMNGALRIGSIMGGWNTDVALAYPLIGKNLLSIPLIKGIKELYIQPSGGGATDKAVKINTMINRCIQGDIDIHELQEQLIDAGFSQIARL